MALVVGTNAYADAAAADTYFADNLRNSSWTALTAGTKDQALVTASQKISLAVKTECKLPFTPPLTNTNLANASFELALEMALDVSVVTQANTGSNTKKVKAGSAEVEFFNPTLNSAAKFPTLVMQHLKAGDCIGGLLPGTIAGSANFGAGSVSDFCNVQPYGLTEGFD